MGYVSDEDQEEFERLKAQWMNGTHADGFPDTKEGQKEFVVLSLKLLKFEIGCMLGHAEENEWPELIFHLTSDIDGMKLVLHSVMEKIIEDKFEVAAIMAEIARAKVEANTGTPVSAFEIAPGIWALKQEEVVVPDDLTGLDGGGVGGGFG